MSDPSQLPQADNSKSAEIPSNSDNAPKFDSIAEPTSIPTVEPPPAQMDVDDPHVTDALDAILGGLLPSEELVIPAAAELSHNEQAIGEDAPQLAASLSQTSGIAPAAAPIHLDHDMEQDTEAQPKFDVNDSTSTIAPSQVDHAIGQDAPTTTPSHIDHEMGQGIEENTISEVKDTGAANPTATPGHIDHAMGQNVEDNAASEGKVDSTADAHTHNMAAAPVALADQQQDVTMGQEPEDSAIIDPKADITNHESSKVDSIPAVGAGQAEPQDVPMDTAPGEEGGPEWEADSSPYESSSSDSSDDSSDEESDGEVLSIQETAKLLMAQMADGSDDEEDGKKGKGPSTAQIKTKNEQTEPVPPKPEITLTESDEIVLLGAVLHVVDNSLVVKGNTDAKYRVLDDGSALCKSDRTIIGVVADVIGNVQSPMYIIRFATAEDITNQGLVAGTQLYYPPQHSKFVFTEALQAIKGSDASNLHDEEVAGNEMEFSDDEKEQAYKKDLKNKRRAGKGQARDGDADTRPTSSYTRNEPTPSESASVLNYDDEEDGPYKPLTRPTNFGQGLPPIPPAPSGGFPGRGRGDSFGRGRGEFRGNRGNRGRGGRGGRGGGGRPDGYSQPPQNRSQASPPQQHTPSFPTPPTNPPAMPNPYQWPYSAPAPPSAYGQASMPFPPPPPPPPTAGGVNIQAFTAWAQSQAQQQRQQQPPVPQHHQHVPQYQQPQPPVPQYQQQQPASGYPQYPPQPQPPVPYGHQQSPAPAWTPPVPPVPQGQAGSYPGYYAGSAQGQHNGWNPNQQNHHGQGR